MKLKVEFDLETFEGDDGLVNAPLVAEKLEEVAGKVRQSTTGGAIRDVMGRSSFRVAD